MMTMQALGTTAALLELLRSQRGAWQVLDAKT